MNRILILYPHFPPSNLAGVHRPRLFASNLKYFGWEPVILTVHEDYYEEALDYDLVKFLPGDLRIEKVKAFRITRPRVVGDLGLRSFFQLHGRAKKLIKDEKFDFLYIPIPSFYCALIGRLLHNTTGIKYGIDYIDPWVHQFPGSERIFSRHWFSTLVAKFLEPIAVKKASLITGVAEGYYQPVFERNIHLQHTAVSAAMPYGGEKMDHEMLINFTHNKFLFEFKSAKLQLVYAGAMLPKAHGILKAIFEVIAVDKSLFEDIEFHFIGTGSRGNDETSFTIRPLAEELGLWQTIVFSLSLHPAKV